MLILAILQIGSAIVLFPVIIWIWATKDFAVALPLTIYLLIVGLADNVLKPMLMGRGLSTPMLVIFIGVLGGMIAHGIVGLFVGPIILAVTWELMMAWIREEQAARPRPMRSRARKKSLRSRRVEFRPAHKPVVIALPGKAGARRRAKRASCSLDLCQWVRFARYAILMHGLQAQ